MRPGSEGPAPEYPLEEAGEKPRAADRALRARLTFLLEALGSNGPEGN